MAASGDSATAAASSSSSTPPPRALGELGGGTQSSQRLLAYSDALLSIIATVMILPVAHTKIHPDQKFDESIQQLLATRVAVYLMTFLIVTVAWAAHVRLFQVIGHIDDILALLNLACMMVITFLPYTFSLMASFPDVPFGIFLFSCCAVIIGAIQAVIVMYGFHHPYLLNHEIQESENQAFYKYHILKIILRGPTLSFFAAIFSFFFIPLSYVFLGLVIFFPHLSHLTKWFRRKFLGQEDEVPLESFTFYLTEPLSKERIETFSDGVYAIVATLLILDICEDNVPDRTEVREKYGGNLINALALCFRAASLVSQPPPVPVRPSDSPPADVIEHAPHGPTVPHSCAPDDVAPLAFLRARERERGKKMVPPVQVSPLIKFSRYSALLVGIIYGKKRYDYLKPIAEEERRIEEEEKKKREEMERIAKELREATEDTILK